MAKRAKTIGLTIVIIIILNACSYSATYKWKISSQLNTQWVSDDKTITFNVNDNYLITGTMEINGEVIEVYVATEPQAGNGLHIFPINVINNERRSTEDEYEYWTCSYQSEKEFVATVKESSFYNVGEKIVFYRRTRGG